MDRVCYVDESYHPMRKQQERKDPSFVPVNPGPLETFRLCVRI